MGKHRCSKYNFYYGIPHAHTSYSTGKGKPTYAYEYAKNKKLDFLIITDHGNSLGESIKYRDKELTKWEMSKKETEHFNKKHDSFLALNGFEASTHPFGDMNIIGSNDFLKNTIRDMDEFCKWLEKQGSPIVTINHPGHNVEKLEYNEKLDKYINFIEVGNGSSSNKYIRYEKYYYMMLNKGFHIGAVNGQDNHRINFGDTDNLTVIVSKDLTKSSIFSALKDRRTYSTESRSLKLMFKANDNIMGSIIKVEEKQRLLFTVMAEDVQLPIESLQLISNGSVILEHKNFTKISSVNWSFIIQPPPTPSWYVIKVIQQNDKIGISSPIFLE